MDMNIKQFDPELLRRAKSDAALRGQSLKDWVSEAMRTRLSGELIVQNVPVGISLGDVQLPKVTHNVDGVTVGMHPAHPDDIDNFSDAPPNLSFDDFGQELRVKCPDCHKLMRPIEGNSMVCSSKHPHRFTLGELRQRGVV